jgi:uncharacterized protein
MFKMNQTMTGYELKEMFSAATDWLEKIVPDINALNVYPVPDGDCGINMLYTMRASLAEASKAGDESVSSIALAMAKGALMGARGNSGVILSQIWRGFAKSLDGITEINGRTWADALNEGSRSAYRALNNPVEGTILTVIKEAANAASHAAQKNDNLLKIFEMTVEAAKTSVKDTPNLLPILKEADVVDAGGHGLFTLLEGALLYIRGDKDGRSPQLITSNHSGKVQPVSTAVEEEAYGFCTQFLLKGEHIDIDGLRSKLEDMGKSLIVVGDSDTVRIHIHTLEPDKVTRFVKNYGKLADVDIRNMDEQHKDFLLMHKGKALKLETATVAVVNGNGFANVFSDLGISAIVTGGQTMNPSTMDLLQAIEAVPSDNVILLPNNKNIIPTANQVQALTRKNIKVIPTESIPQGVAALVSFSPDADFKTDFEQMMKIYPTVKTIEITRSTRTMKFDGLEIREGQVIGLLDGKLIAASDKIEDLIIDMLSRMDLSSMTIITMYYSSDNEAANAEAISNKIRQLFPRLEVEILNGGQPHYNYIISVE